jgi:hypothetical protein
MLCARQLHLPLYCCGNLPMMHPTHASNCINTQHTVQQVEMYGCCRCGLLQCSSGHTAPASASDSWRGWCSRGWWCCRCSSSVCSRCEEGRPRADKGCQGAGGQQGSSAQQGQARCDCGMLGAGLPCSANMSQLHKVFPEYSLSVHWSPARGGNSSSANRTQCAPSTHTLCTCIHTRNHCVNTVLHCTNLQPPAPALPHRVKFEVCRWQVSCPNSTAGRGSRCSEGSSSLLTAWAPAGAAVCAC